MSTVYFILLLSYPWPIRHFNTAHGVSGTLGDGRGIVTAPRFHRGIDIPASNGTDVFSITSDSIIYTTAGDGMYIGNYWYIHLTNMAAETTNVLGILDTTTTPPTQIGDVMDYGGPGHANDHLHFQIGPTGGPFFNPLSYDGGPINYSDGSLPIVYSLDFWKSGSEGENPEQLQSPLWGKIDIRARCRDLQNSGGVNTTTGIYRLEYLISNRDTNASFGPFQTTIFPQVQPPNNGDPVLLVYDRHNYSSSSPFNYWVTNPIINNQVHNRYWNTKLKTNQSWNGQDARINQEAQYPDGRYRVEVTAYDIETNAGSRHEDVLLDNFVPFVSQVIVEREGEVVYNGNWELSGNGMQLNVPTEDSVSRGDDIHLKISFSEFMDGNQINVKLEKSGHHVNVSGSWNFNNTVWEGDATIPDENWAEGAWSISISSQDVAGNILDKRIGVLTII